MQRIGSCLYMTTTNRALRKDVYVFYAHRLKMYVAMFNHGSQVTAKSDFP